MIGALLFFLLTATAATWIMPVPAASQEPKRLRISLPGLGSASYPVVMALKKGYYRAEGYEVELIPMAAGLAVKTLLAGEVAYTTASTVYATMQGAQLPILMVFVRERPFDLVADSGIKRVEDLRGRRVAVADRGSITYFVVRTILKAHGLEPDRDVTLLTMGRPDVRYQSLLSGIVQATVANFDGTALLELKGYHSVAKASRYMKGFAGSLAASQENIQRHPEELKRIVRASMKGSLAYIQLRQEAIRITSEWTRTSVEIAERVHDLMAAGALAPDGLLDREGVQATITEAQEGAKVKRTLSPEDIFDFRIAQQVAHELQSQGWRP